MITNTTNAESALRRCHGRAEGLDDVTSRRRFLKCGGPAAGAVLALSIAPQRLLADEPCGGGNHTLVGWKWATVHFEDLIPGLKHDLENHVSFLDFMKEKDARDEFSKSLEDGIERAFIPKWVRYTGAATQHGSTQTAPVITGGGTAIDITLEESKIRPGFPGGFSTRFVMGDSFSADPKCGFNAPGGRTTLRSANCEAIVADRPVIFGRVEFKMTIPKTNISFTLGDKQPGPLVEVDVKHPPGKPPEEPKDIIAPNTQ